MVCARRQDALAVRRKLNVFYLAAVTAQNSNQPPIRAIPNSWEVIQSRSNNQFAVWRGRKLIDLIRVAFKNCPQTSASHVPYASRFITTSRNRISTVG